ncbi:MAG: DUF2752 domain-containing protein [Phycisphaerae bacterium]
MSEFETTEPTAPRPGTAFHPLGSVVFRVQARRPARARLIGAAVFVGCVLILGLAARLEPASAGFGSHQQMGLPPCSMLVIVGYPCPTCGMTTAFAHTVRGQLLSAFRAQPAGLFLALSTILAAGLAVSTMLTGRVWAVNWYRISPTWLVIGLVVLIVGGWVFKIIMGIVTGTLPVTS